MTAPTITKIKKTAFDTEFALADNFAFREGRDKLPKWGSTPYTAAEMSALGVSRVSIVKMFLRPDVLGDAFGEVVCRIAEAVMPAVEDGYPDDIRPSAAIEAARRCFANPSFHNKAAAFLAAAAADEAAWDSGVDVAEWAVEAQKDEEQAPLWAASRAARAACAVAAAAGAGGSDDEVRNAKGVAELANKAGLTEAALTEILGGARI